MAEKVVVSKGIAKYTFDSGNLNSVTAKKFANSVNISFINIRNLNIEAILFSLENIKQYDEDGVKVLFEKLSHIEKDFKLIVGFSGYNTKLFKFLRSIVDGSKVGLFEDRKTLLFFMNKSFVKQGDTILIYIEDKIDRELLLADIISRGYFTIAPTTFEGFSLKYKKRGSYALAIKNIYYPFSKNSNNSESLGTEKVKEAHIDSNKRLTKDLIKELPLFIESIINTFESMINLKAKKEKSELCKFDITNSNYMVSYISFDGKLDGIVLLIFPISLANKAYEALFFEETDSEDELKDAIKEFANIIAGQAKTALESKGLHVNISLPKSFMSISEIAQEIGTKQGVKVKFMLEDDPLYVFLTR